MEREKERRERALAAVVAARLADPRAVWPDLFAVPGGDQEAFPSTAADMTDFRWEKPSEQQARDELEMLMHGARVTVPDPEAHPAAGKVPPPPAAAPPPREPPKYLRPGARLRPPDGDRSALEWG